MDDRVVRMLRRTAVLGTAASAGALVAKLAERAWRSATDPDGPDGLALPEGVERIVNTADGAELAVTDVAPSRDGRRGRHGEDAYVDTATIDDARRGSKRGRGRIAFGRRRAPTIVLVHCFACDRRTWAPVARRLVAAGHRVVVYDQRGHGQSTLGTAAPTASQLGDDLATVIQQIGLHRTVVAGHSMGGFAAMAFACDHPDLLRDRVSGLVLVATAANGVGLRGLDPLAAWVLRSRALGWVMSQPRLGLMFTRATVGRRPVHAHLTAARDMFVATDAAVRAACFVGFSRSDHREGLAKVDVPTVVLVGDRDPLTPPRMARAIVRTIPDARLEVLPGAGHMLPLETPDRVADVIGELAGDLS
ncbi:MAG: alpha/beta fold hydrolase [Acidimicrobiales bacterium]